MSFTQRKKSSDGNYSADHVVQRRHKTSICTYYTKSIRKITPPKTLIFGIIVGLCFSQLNILIFPKTLPNHQSNNKISSNRKHKQDKTIADQLFEEVRVLCWVMTGPKNHESRAQHVKNTWGRRCNKLLFMSSAEDTKLGTVVLPVTEGREHFWDKTKEAFKYIYEHHLDEYDWFIKTDDDTYVIVENLRKMLYAYSTEFPIILGTKLKDDTYEMTPVFMAGGAGYVLSREALKRFIEKALPDATKCKQKFISEDVQMSECLQNVEVLGCNTRDEYGRGRMFQLLPENHLIPDRFPYWYEPFIYGKPYQGPDCCSDHAISFHEIDPNKMYLFDYMIYQLRPFGIIPATDILPKKKTLDEIVSENSISSNRTTWDEKSPN